MGSLGAIVSPALVGWLMERAGYVASPEGTQPPAEMVANMVAGVDQSFIIAGIILLLAGVLGLFFMRPDMTARRLQVATAQ